MLVALIFGFLAAGPTASSTVPVALLLDLLAGGSTSSSTVQVALILDFLADGSTSSSTVPVALIWDFLAGGSTSSSTESAACDPSTGCESSGLFEPFLPAADLSPNTHPIKMYEQLPAKSPQSVPKIPEPKARTLGDTTVQSSDELYKNDNIGPGISANGA